VLECCPRLRTSSVTDRNRSTVGVVGDGGFLTAVVLVESQRDPLRAGREGTPLPLSAAAEVLRIDDIELASVQVVQHTQSAPATHLPEHALAVRSYLELTEAQVPAVRLTWVALKLEPERCPRAVLARGGGAAGAHRALLRAVHQLRAELAIRGLRATPLTEHELTAALAASASVNPLVGAQGSQQHTARRTRETPRGWRCDDRWHVTYWISHWPSLTGPHGPDLIGVLSGVPALASSFSTALAPDGEGGFALAAHLRVAARSERGLAEASKLVEARGRQAGVGLVRLDGEQLPGVLATLPLGGALHLGLT
jgi:type VII secretion protein EccE